MSSLTISFFIHILDIQAPANAEYERKDISPMWRYKSPIGSLYIKKLNNGLYGFLYNGTILEACPTPQIEADNIYMHCTGCSDWDSLDGKVSDVPTDLSEWEVI